MTLQSPTDDFHRTSDSPVTFFRLRALHFAREIGVDLGEVLEAVGIVTTAFGESWLNDAAENVSRGTALPFRRHPLGDLISIAGLNQVAEVVELAGYLRSVASDPRLSMIIDGIKAQYHQSLLQLAFAAKVRAVGASDVALEPDATGGRMSDIVFTFQGERFRAECYRPTVKPDASYDESSRLATAALKAIPYGGPILSVGVSLNGELSADVRKEVSGVIARLAKNVLDSIGPDERQFPAFMMIGAAATVSVCRALPVPPGSEPRLMVAPQFPKQGRDWDIFVRQNVAYESDMAGVAGDVNSGVGLNHCAIWLCDSTREQRSLKQDLKAPLEKLGHKIEAKLSQARSEAGDRRLMIADSWMTAQLPRVDKPVVERLRKKIVGAHENVAGLLLVSRGWSGEQTRHIYEHFPLLGDEPSAATTELVARLRQLESREHAS